MVKTPIKKSGFIVHPWETGDNQYHASYGNNNKTVKSFKTLKKAKDYLKRNKIQEALYDAPHGTKEIDLTKKPRKQTYKKLGQNPFKIPQMNFKKLF